MTWIEEDESRVGGAGRFRVEGDFGEVDMVDNDRARRYGLKGMRGSLAASSGYQCTRV